MARIDSAIETLDYLAKFYMWLEWREELEKTIELMEEYYRDLE